MTRDPIRRSGRSCRGSIVALALVATAVAWLVLWDQWGWNRQFDLTGRRSFELSASGSKQVESLTGAWEITVLLPATGIDASNTRQVLDTLAAMDEVSESMATHVIDPTGDAASAQVQTLLAALHLRYGDEMAAWNRSMSQAVATLEALVNFVRSRPTLTAGLREHADPQWARAVAAFDMLARQGDVMVDAIEATQLSRIDQPIPHYAKGQALATEALLQWSTQLSVLAGAVAETSGDLMSPEPLALEAMAIQLAGVAEELAASEPPPLEGVGDLLTRGYGAVVMSPTQAMIIPGSMLFPAHLLHDEGSVTMDRRFRGEHVLTGPLRVLSEGRQQTIVFVHGEDHSLLEPHEAQADVTAVAAMAHLAGYGIQEWIPGRTPRPDVSSGGGVWVIVPPLTSPGAAPDDGEQLLLEAADDLLSTTTDPVLLTLRPSLLPRYGTIDPWADLLDDLPVAAETGVIVASRSPAHSSVTTSVAAVTLQGGGEHPIARSLGGLRLVLPFAQPLTVDAGGLTLLEIPSGDDRWFEGQWQRALPSPSEVPGEAHLTDPVPIVVGVEQATGQGDRRIIVVGSASWLLGAITDLAIASEGDETVLLNPGNTQLLLSSLAWLTGNDDAVAQSAVAQQMDRLVGVTPGVEVMARWMLLLLVPGLWLACPIVFKRRGR